MPRRQIGGLTMKLTDILAKRDRCVRKGSQRRRSCAWTVDPTYDARVDRLCTSVKRAEGAFQRASHTAKR